MGRMQFSFRDFSEERSTVDFAIVDLTAGNIAANLTAFDTVAAAIDGVTLGTLATRRLVAVDEVVSSVIPANPFAQRELKWLVRYTDTVNGKSGSLEIPTADPTGIMVAGTDRMDLSITGTPTALVTALETNGRTVDGNTFNITGIFLVGRNL